MALSWTLVGATALVTLVVAAAVAVAIEGAFSSASSSSSSDVPPNTSGGGSSNKAGAAAQTKAAKAAHSVSASAASSPVIFVSIPSYRDPDLGHTLRTLFLHADRPRAVRVGVYQQNAPGDLEGVAEYKRLASQGGDGTTFAGNIMSRVVAHTTATGPTAARAAIEKTMLSKVPDAKYLLMVDSHTFFCKGWDTYLVDALEATDDPEHVVLSTYAPHFDRGARDRMLGEVSMCAPRRSFFMYFKEFMPDGFPRFDSRPCAQVAPAAFASLGWAAGFSFARAAVHRTVPYVDFPWLFFGEEFLMHARLATHGFTVLTPPKTPVLTNFDRSYRPTFLGDATGDWRSKRTKVSTRIQRLLAAQSVDTSLFGTEVTLNEFVDEVGIDVATGDVNPVKAAGVMEEDPFDLAYAQEVTVKHGTKAAFARLKHRFD